MTTTKVLFLVPTALLPRLIIHPILCRGSTFTLTVDESNSSSSNGSHDGRGGNGSMDSDYDDEDASFLAVDFESPYPNDMAREIAIRLTKRLEDAKCDQEASRQNFLMLS